ncbi:MAG: hypothetical protein DI629_12250 [Mesorhizobium amorphae]|nr:MAG: hypothetical protein DI629_12250 [Mesorhizobium amorphae]
MTPDPTEARKVAITGPTAEKVGRMAAFADAWRMEAWPFDREAECLAFLSGHSDVAGILVADNQVEGCDTLIAWRAAGLTAPVLVLLSDRRHGPDDLARLIMAGAQDAQHLSASDQEIAARMFRLTQHRALGALTDMQEAA